jgi:hypothetical protein
MDPEIFVHDDDRCVLIAKDRSSDTLPGKFNRVISDIADVYPTAILVGAVAASKYIGYSNEPRITYDVDILLDEKNFSDFLLDDIPLDTVTKLENFFDDSDSANHSLKHKETGIYLDLLSIESKPIRKKIVRHILENRDKTTHVLQIGEQSIDILRPEFLIAMKLNRYSKKPRSERGLCDRIDIMKVLKALWGSQMTMDHEAIRAVCNRNEAECYFSILEDVENEMDE